MRVSTRLVGVGLAAASVLATTAAAAGSPEGDGPAPAETVVFTTPWVGGEQSYVDVGTTGIGPGDLFLLTGLPMHAQGKRIGTMDAVETILSGTHDGVVSQQITLRLHDGRIMIDGIARHDDQPFQLAVVGGTGKYDTVRGRFVVLREDEHRSVTVQELVLYR
ncbi:hypothetical protein ACPPVT_21780 [Angustibacter sp. McL0619]|uniref:hypothetical protein n=1 Tax=Angustibacter sp. McL0619 TaxID=3415676 RepID=UPI003CECDAC0